MTHPRKSELLHLSPDAPPLSAPLGLVGEEGVPQRQAGPEPRVGQGN